jgi:hypothetical protein
VIEQRSGACRPSGQLTKTTVLNTETRGALGIFREDRDRGCGPTTSKDGAAYASVAVNATSSTQRTPRSREAGNRGILALLPVQHMIRIS